MAGLIRGLTWDDTRLGPVNTWSDSLLTAINLLLAAPIPMQLLWGGDLIILYNDAMRFALSDKHPKSLGKAGRVVWSEVWDVVGPQLEKVYTSGNPLSVNNVPLKLLREGSLSQMYWDYSYSPVYDVDGAVAGVLNVARNVTEHHQTQQALLQSEKLAAVGKLAATIAHEINNPLESVTNLLYLARHSEDATEVPTYLDLAERELRRISVISWQTLRFHRQSTSPSLVTCEDLFESVLSVYQGRLVNSQIHVERLKRGSRAIECFDGEIRQVLSNLVGNAIDAMSPQGGRLLIRSHDATDWATGRTGLRMTVADTGSGMPAATQSKAFEAFYTTKGFGGTGLGLWVSKEIVDRHQGRLRFRSRQGDGGHGTVFSLFLPFAAVARVETVSAKPVMV